MKLTPSQERSLHYSKNILVEAGAGSGKTLLFVERFCKILEENPTIEPKQILALTFTKKAASECASRLYTRCLDRSHHIPHFKTVLSQLHQAQLTTIHGFCATLLKDYFFEAGLSAQSIILSEEEGSFFIESSIQQSIEELSQKKDSHLRTALSIFSEQRLKETLKNCFYKHATLSQYSTTQRQSFTPLSQAVLFIYEHCNEKYQAKKDALHALDYDDLIRQTLSLLSHQDIQRDLQEQFRFIMVDECQDTDPSQWQIITALCHSFAPLDEKKLFLVGDPKQCIYRFRGANLSFFNSLSDDFKAAPDLCDVITLTDNFRSAPQLLNTLNTLFHPLFKHPTKTLFHPLEPFKKDPAGKIEAILLKDSKDASHECEAIAQWIHTYTETPEKNYQDIVILARQHSHCDIIKKYLEKKDIPVSIDKQRGFFQQQLIIDCFQIIKVLLHPDDKVTWFSLLHSPLFGLSLDLCFQLFRQQDQTVLESLSRLRQDPAHSQEDRDSLSSAESTVRSWMIDKNLRSLYEQLKTILYSGLFESTFSANPESPAQAKQFLSILLDLEHSQAATRSDLLAQLEYRLSLFDATYENTAQVKNAVTLMTIHASKGLEFPVVIVAGCHKKFWVNTTDSCLISDSLFHVDDKSLESEGIRKDFFLNEKAQSIDEERRLFYVACTRAENQLVLTGLFNANDKGSSYLQFLKDLPDFQTAPDSFSFLDETSNSRIHIPCRFQCHLNEAPIMTQKTANDATLLPPKTSFPASTHTDSLSLSAIEKQLSNSPLGHFDHSLDLAQSSHYGILIHDLIMTFIASRPSLEKLLSIATQHPSYTVFSSAQKKQLPRDFERLIKSKILTSIDPNTLLFEYPIQTALESIQALPESYVSLSFCSQTEVKGRLDILELGETEARIIDIKTDTGKDLSTLMDSYRTQLQLYAHCIRQQFPSIDTINIAIYSSALDELIEETTSVPLF